MSVPENKLKSALAAGAKHGWKSFLWMSEVVVPISFLVTLLQWSGWLNQIVSFLGPWMALLGLPAEAALPIVSGMLINIYAVIAILGVIPFTTGQMTLIAIFSLIAHNMILEGIVQFRSGINVVKATLVRIVTATIVMVVSHFFTGTGEAVVIPAALSGQTALAEVLKNWALSTGTLLLRMFGIIMFIMILLEVSRQLGWIDRLLNVFRPITRLLGLSSQTTVMFIAGIVFGLMYGGAVIVEEGKKGTLTREEIDHLHISLGINHSMVEDPALFAMLGVNLLWLWIPRLIAAIIAVQVSRLWRRLWGRAGAAVTPPWQSQ